MFRLLNEIMCMLINKWIYLLDSLFRKTNNKLICFDCIAMKLIRKIIKK